MVMAAHIGNRKVYLPDGNPGLAGSVIVRLCALRSQSSVLLRAHRTMLVATLLGACAAAAQDDGIRPAFATAAAAIDAFDYDDVILGRYAARPSRTRRGSRPS